MHQAYKNDCGFLLRPPDSAHWPIVLSISFKFIRGYLGVESTYQGHDPTQPCLFYLFQIFHGVTCIFWVSPLFFLNFRQWLTVFQNFPYIFEPFRFFCFFLKDHPWWFPWFFFFSFLFIIIFGTDCVFKIIPFF